MLRHRGVALVDVIHVQYLEAGHAQTKDVQTNIFTLSKLLFDSILTLSLNTIFCSSGGSPTVELGESDEITSSYHY
jgi:hypothetical protein